MFCRSMQCSLFSWKTGHQTRNLISQENDVSTLMGKELLPMETKRYRDIVRKASIRATIIATIAITGIPNTEADIDLVKLAGNPNTALELEIISVAPLKIACVPSVIMNG